MARKTKMVHSILILSVVISLVGNDKANAGGLLDYIRAYDLDDYALAMTVSTSQNPYLDGENSVIDTPF